MRYNSGLAQKVLAGIGTATVVSFGIATCVGVGYKGIRLYNSLLTACVEAQEAECPENECPECPEASESDVCVNVDLGGLLNPPKTVQSLTLCDEVTKALSKKGSSTDVHSVVTTYVTSSGGEVIVKDANALYSLLVAPKQGSKCDDEKLEKKFVEKITEMYPTVANLKPHGAEDRNYVTLRIIHGGLVVDEALVYNLSKSSKL